MGGLVQRILNALLPLYLGQFGKRLFLHGVQWPNATWMCERKPSETLPRCFYLLFIL